MKLVSYLNNEQDQLAILVNGLLYNLDEMHPNLPASMGMFLNYWDDFYPLALEVESAIREKRFLQERGFPISETSLIAPVPFPASLRFGSGFLNNNNSADRERIRPEWRFGNHHAIQGGGAIACMPDHLNQLEFDLQVAAVICRPGRNLAAEIADHYIGGLMILNNFCSKSPRGGRLNNADFAISTGPYFVTLDELETACIPPKLGHLGKTWTLKTQCIINDKTVGTGNMGYMDWTFAEIIEQASYGVQLYPGDIITCGTVPDGSLSKIPGGCEAWLTSGDVVEMRVEQLGKLYNNILREDSNWTLQHSET